MTRRLKALRPTELIKALERAGFEKKRQTGSHVIMTRPGHRSIPVPTHPGTLKRPLQERIIKQAGLTQKDISKLLR